MTSALIVLSFCWLVIGFVYGAVWMGKRKDREFDIGHAIRRPREWEQR